MPSDPYQQFKRPLLLPFCSSRPCQNGVADLASILAASLSKPFLSTESSVIVSTWRGGVSALFGGRADSFPPL